ncbi:MAG: hypothetical protein AABX07_03400 [Nanoarchaeota archaeon]
MESKELKIDANEILMRLVRLQNDMNYVKEHINDVTLTEEDLSSVREAKKDLGEGKTKRL